MANTFISVMRGANALRHDAVTIGTATAGLTTTDFEFRVAALDQNSNPINTLDMLLALAQIKGVIESNGVFTTALTLTSEK
jgi:hypothetical protein